MVIWGSAASYFSRVQNRVPATDILYSIFSPQKLHLVMLFCVTIFPWGCKSLSDDNEFSRFREFQVQQDRLHLNSSRKACIIAPWLLL